jgi:hypothetical protein
LRSTVGQCVWYLSSYFPRERAAKSSGDPFGIKKIYPTKGGDQWYMNMDSPTSDGRFNPQASITKNPDGSWKMLSTTKVRMDVWMAGSSPCSS